MIYRYCFDGDAGDSFWTEHRYGQWLLAYALFCEKKLKVSETVILRNQWGKPFLRDFPDIEFNISHCNGLVGCVVSDVPVGIDVERIRPYSRYAARYVCSKAELDDIMQAQDPDRRFFYYWTLKESCAKAMGTGITHPLRDINFQIEGHNIVCKTQSEFQFVLFEHKERFVISVCYRRSGRSYRVCEYNGGQSNEEYKFICRSGA